MSDREAIRSRMNAAGIEFLLAQFVDIHGSAKVKMVPYSGFDDMIDSGAGFAGAAVWAGVTVVTEYQIGWMAVGLGFLVGIAIRTMGRGIDQVFGVVGAVMALVGCVLGNVFTIAWYISAQTGSSLISVLTQLDMELVIDLITETFQVMDILFYGLALYFGYKYAFRQLTLDDFNRALGRAI